MALILNEIEDRLHVPEPQSSAVRPLPLTGTYLVFPSSSWEDLRRTMDQIVERRVRLPEQNPLPIAPLVYVHKVIPQKEVRLTSPCSPSVEDLVYERGPDGSLLWPLLRLPCRYKLLRLKAYRLRGSWT
jgi:hypothetical protein